MGIARRHSDVFLTCLVVLLSLLALPSAASATPGELDAAFGEGGRVATAVDEVAPDWSSTGPGPTLRPESFGDDVHLAAAPDGSLVVAYGNLLLHYLPDGQLDPGFGEAGRLAISTVEGLPFGISDIAVDNEGKILVFGTTVDPSVSRFIYGYNIREVSPSYVTVLRFDATGALDPSFGNGGVFRDDLGLRPTRGVPADIPLVEAESAEIDSMGRAVIAVGKVGFPPSIRTTPGWVGDALVRLTPTGMLDPTFGVDGVVENVLGRSEQAFLGGFCVTSEKGSMIALASGALVRLQADGRLDSGFGHHGIAPADGGWGPPICDRSAHLFMLKGPGTFFPTREDPSLWKVIRVSAENGRLNRGFSRRAVVRLRGRYSLLTSLTIDRDGRVLLAGVERLPAPKKMRRSSSFVVFRLLPSGRLDRTFGHKGQVRTELGSSASLSFGAGEATTDASGRLVVAGSARASWLQPEGVLVARYLLRP